MQTVNAWACRSDRQSPWQMGWGGNRLLTVAALVELAIAAACLVVVPVADVLEHRVPPAHVWLVIAAAAATLLVADHVDKRRRHRREPG
jgi:hypothetical protein